MKRWQTVLVLLAVLMLAAFLRFYHLDWTEYKLDEANISRLALNMVRYGQVPRWGIGSSVGIPNGALSAWLLAIPYAASSSPLVATGFIAALNVLAVAMTFAFTRKLAGAKAALIAAWLFAVAPWAVLNSRKLWAQDLLPPFVVAYMWTAYLAFVEKKHGWLLVHVLTLAACIQLHYSALTLVLLTAFCSVVFWWRKWPWKVLLTALAASLLVFAPFIYLDAKQGFSTVKLFLQTAFSRPSTVDASAFQMAWIMVTGHDLHSLAGPQEFGNFLNSTLPVTPLFTMFGVLTVAALVWALWRAALASSCPALAWRASAASRRTRPFRLPGGESGVSQGRHCAGDAPGGRDAQAKAGFLAAMGIVFPVVLFVRHSTPVYPHYFILLYPWPFVLIGMSVAWLAEQRPRWRVMGWGGALVAVALIAVIAAAQVYDYLSIMHFVAGRYTPGGYGTPVGLTLRAVHTAEQMAREMNGDIVVKIEGATEPADEIAAIWEVLVDPAFAPRVLTEQAMVFPATPTVYVIAVPREYPDWLVIDDIISPLRPGEDYYIIDKDIFAKPLPGNLSWVGPDRWVNGVQLLSALGYGDLRPGGTCILETVWRVNSLPPPGVDYHWFNHLVDADGKRVGQMDGVGFPSRSWRVGDVIVAWFDVPVAPDAKPGAYKMRVGMYTYPDIQNVPVVDAAGNPASDAVEVGPIEIKTNAP